MLTSEKKLKKINGPDSGKEPEIEYLSCDDGWYDCIHHQ